MRWSVSKRADENALSSSEQHHWSLWQDSSVLTQLQYVKADNIKDWENTADPLCPPTGWRRVGEHLESHQKSWGTEIWYGVNDTEQCLIVLLCMCSSMPQMSSIFLIQILCLSLSQLYFDVNWTWLRTKSASIKAPLLLYGFKEKFTWGCSPSWALVDC